MHTSMFEAGRLSPSAGMNLGKSSVESGAAHNDDLSLWEQKKNSDSSASFLLVEEIVVDSSF